MLVAMIEIRLKKGQLRQIKQGNEAKIPPILVEYKSYRSVRVRTGCAGSRNCTYYVYAYAVKQKPS
jgi:hypothetical protein